MKRIRKLSLGMILMFATSLPIVGCNESKQVEETIDELDVPSDINVELGSEYQMEPTFLPIDAKPKCTYLSSDPTIATIDSNGLIRALKGGVCMVQTRAGGKVENTTVHVHDPNDDEVYVKSITFDNQVIKLNIGSHLKLNPVVTPSNAWDKSITYTSSDPETVSVSQYGVLEALKEGSATIYAKNVKAGLTVNLMVNSIDPNSTQTEEDLPLYVKKIDSLKDRDDFMMIMDASAVPSLENAGVKYKGFDGNEQDVFKILKDSGITDIRVRIWNDPYITSVADSDLPNDITSLASYTNTHHGDVKYSYGGGNCDVENAVAIATRCNKYGLGMVIDFHYSDFWADPGKQQAPKAWKKLDHDEKTTAIKNFTKDSLDKIKAVNSKIDVVQIGNETNSTIMGAGIKTKDGADYFNAGSQGVRESTGTVDNGGAKVAIHLANCAGHNFSEEVNAFKNNKVDYDVFGCSYYPGFHGTNINDITTNLRSIHQNSGKEVMILENSYPYTDEDFDGNGNTAVGVQPKPFTVQGQANETRDVIESVANAGNYAIGYSYWEGTWIAPGTGNGGKTSKDLCNQYGCGWASALAGPTTLTSPIDTSIHADGYQAKDVNAAGGVVIENQAFFNTDGTPNKSLNVFKLVKDGQEDVKQRADYLTDVKQMYEVNKGPIVLPTKVDIVTNDDNRITTPAIWDVSQAQLAEMIGKVGKYTVEGTTAYKGKVYCTILVTNTNIITDHAGFEGWSGTKDGTNNKVQIDEPWKLNGETTGNALQLYVGNFNAEMGSNSLHFWCGHDQKWDIYRDITIADSKGKYGNGKYTFSLDFMGDKIGNDQDGFVYELCPYIEITKSDGTTQRIKGENYVTTGFGNWDNRTVSVTIDDSVTAIKVGIYADLPLYDSGAWGNFDVDQFYFDEV